VKVLERCVRREQRPPEPSLLSSNAYQEPAHVIHRYYVQTTTSRPLSPSARLPLFKEVRDRRGSEEWTEVGGVRRGARGVKWCVA